MKSIRRFYLVSFLAVVVMACGEATEPLTPATIEISGPTFTYDALGQQVNYSASVFDQNGNPLPNVTVTWSSSDPTVLEVDPATGVAVSQSNGTAQLIAEAETAKANRQITVSQVPKTIEKIAGGEQAAVAGADLPDPVTVRVEDKLGSPVVDVEVKWSADRGGVARPSSVNTDSSGIAATRWTLGKELGEQRLSARVSPSVTTNFLARGLLILATIDTGAGHTCGLSTLGFVYCWGRNAHGQLGDGSSASSGLPQLVVGDLEFEAISAGNAHSCALSVDGKGYCWGRNSLGQLGDGTTINRRQPTPVEGNRTFSEINAGALHTCAITTENAAYCWGEPSEARLGTETLADNTVPNEVQGNYSFRSIRPGHQHTCGIPHDSSAFALCWGDNDFGQLGDGTTEQRLTPTSVDIDFSLSVVIPLGHDRTCALSDNEDVFCWGRNDSGGIGDGTTETRRTPTQVSAAEAYSEIAVGLWHSCALSLSGTVECWGDNFYGQLGTGSTEDTTLPMKIDSDVEFVSVSSEVYHTCGITRDQATFCWGLNDAGQLGDGTSNNRSTPVRVTYTPR